MKLVEVLNLIALLVGPLVGIWVTRWIDRGKELDRRRWGLFETLMRTRGLELTPEHVGAINLVPVVFRRKSDAEVIRAWERLMDTLNDPDWDGSDENRKRAAVVRSLGYRRDLVQEVARAVGEELPAKEEHRPGYAPRGWMTEQEETAEMRHLLKEVLTGRSALSMRTAVVDYTSPLGVDEVKHGGEAAE